MSEKHLIHIWNGMDWTGAQYLQSILQGENSPVPVSEYDQKTKD